MSAPRQPPGTPIMVELAPLPRHQMGPFLILGVAKDAPREAVEAGWAQKLISARRNVIKTPLEDINWARELLNDPQRRLQAEAASLNIETSDGTLAQLRQATQAKAGCKPIDVEKNLEQAPAVTLPDMEDLRRAVVVPEIVREVPVVALLLKQFAAEPVDPWDTEAWQG